MAILSMLTMTAPSYADGCAYQSFKKEKVEIRINPDCRVDIYPRVNGGRKRNYSFYPNGFLIAFVDTEDYDTNSASTGSRTFYLFPVISGTQPQVQENSFGKYEIVSASGAHITLRNDGELDTVNGGKVSTRPLSHMDQISRDMGGIEIEGQKGVLLDHGWSKGGIAYRRLGNASVIRDERGHSCSVKNSEMYSRNPRDSGDPLKKFHNQEQWRRFIAQRCVNIQWSEAAYKTRLERPSQSADPLGDLLEKLDRRSNGAR